MANESEPHAAFDEILRRIIDEWYERVAAFYVTSDEPEGADDGAAELKRFHDERGHRIKFNKDDLDFTYGLRVFEEDGDSVVEVSVNNKVDRFDYEGFRDKLEAYYVRTRGQRVPTPYELRTRSYNDIFQLGGNFNEAFSVEIHPDRADIMGLSFRLTSACLAKLMAHPVSAKELVEKYCVAPFRNVYATVYRRGS